MSSGKNSPDAGRRSRVGFPALVFLAALALLSLTLPPLWQVVRAEGPKPDQAPTATSPHPVQLDAQHRPITAGGFVPSGPIVFEDASERAGLARWTHSMGTPAKTYLLETKGSGVGLIDYDNDGWLDLYIVNGSNFD